MSIKSFYILIALAISTFSVSAQTSDKAIGKFTGNHLLKHASIGFCVKDLSGKQITSYNAFAARTPASTLKTITTATALEVLGGDYCYKTTLAKDVNNPNHLLIRGSGDPTLGTSRLDNDPTLFLIKWAKEIKQNIDTTQNIDITIIDDYFGYEGISERWIWQDMGIQYAAPAYGISVFDNTAKLHLNTMRRDTLPTILYCEPQMDMEYTNKLSLNTKGQDNGYVRGEPLSYKRILTGDIPAGREDFILKGDIPNPGLVLGQQLAEELAKNNIKINSINTTNDIYNASLRSGIKYTFDEDIFYTHLSPPLRDIIREINIESNNHYTEHLIRTIGRTANEDIYSPALDLGISKTKEIWKKNGLDTNALFMYDGCGLAPSNAVSPDFLCDLLVYMLSKSKNTEDYINSFAIAGKDGTVKNLLKNTRLSGKVHVKSGTIANVRCYAGYYIDNDKKYAFAIMVNNYNSPLTEVVRAIEKLLLDTF